MANRRTFHLQKIAEYRQRIAEGQGAINDLQGRVLRRPEIGLPGYEDPEKAALKQQIEDYTGEIAELEARILAAEVQLASLDDEDMAVAREGASFWFRRFFTSLALVHGAAFAATISGLLQAQHPEQLASVAVVPLALFGGGVVSAGLIPLALYTETIADSGVLTVFEQQSDLIGAAAGVAVNILATVSALLFVAALYLTVSGVGSLVHTKALRPPPPAHSPKSAPLINLMAPQPVGRPNQVPARAAP